MKKLAIIFAAIAVLAGCQKDKTSLAGETYAAFAYHSDAWEIAGMHFDGYDAYYVYRFIDQTRAERTVRQYSPIGEIIGDIEDCTYTYKYPYIEIKYYNTSRKLEVTEKGEFLDKDTFRINKKDYIKQ